MARLPKGAILTQNRNNYPLWELQRWAIRCLNGLSFFGEVSSGFPACASLALRAS
jgi:hypothetical protein